MKAQVAIGFLDASSGVTIKGLTAGLVEAGLERREAEAIVRDVFLRLGDAGRPKILALDCDDASYFHVRAAADTMTREWVLLGAKVLAQCFILQALARAALSRAPTLGHPVQ
jgi:hypothetical protein